MRGTMRGLGLARALLVAGAIVLAHPVDAQTPPADSAIKAAVYDLDKIAGELPRLTPGRTANIQRLTRSLDGAEAQLERSPNKTHPSWTEAKLRIADYRAKLAAIDGGAPAQASPAPTTVTPQSTPGPATPRLTSSGQAQLNRLVQQARQAEQQLAALAPKALHQPSERQRWAGLVSRLQSELASFADFSALPEVQEVRGLVEAAATRHARLDAEATAQLATLGDIPARIQAIRAELAPDRLPRPLDPPYEEARLQAWADGLRLTASQMQTGRQWLQQTMAATDLHATDLANTLNGTIGHTANSAIETAVARTRELARQPLAPLQGRIDFLLAIGPADQDKIRNNLLAEGKIETLYAEIDQGEKAVQDARRIEAALKLQPPTDMEPWQEKLGRLRTHITGLFEASVAAVRMPPTRSQDQKLASIAKEVLEDPRYAVGPWRRLVVSSELRSQQEERGYVSGNMITFYKYDYDQFQVTTVEPKDGTFYLWFNTLKLSRSGDPTTPLNRWYLTNRFQGSRILEENIDK